MEKTDKYTHNKETPSLTTLIVEIKAIRVDDKAMTISLFNQITHRDIIDYYPIKDFTILGVVKRITRQKTFYWTLFSIEGNLYKSLRCGRYRQFSTLEEETYITEKKIITREEIKTLDYAKQIYIAV